MRMSIAIMSELAYTCQAILYWEFFSSVNFHIVQYRCACSIYFLNNLV